VSIHDPKSAEIQEAQIFVATLGASNYTFAEASLSQQLSSWVLSHVHAFAFFGGVPAVTTPDNLKSGVTRACRYEPDLNATYRAMAKHYGTVIIPARKGKPRDKAKVESAVLQTARRILAPLRNHTFFSLAELNQAIDVQLERLNNRPLQSFGVSRRTLFETLDQPALNPLPTQPYILSYWKKAKVNIDYHVEVDHHYYSVPYQLIHQTLDVSFTDTTVEILRKGQRVASHLRSYRRGGHTTLAEHMPKAHQKYLDWSPSRLIHWAAQIGPDTCALVGQILASRPHPEQGYRSCLGLLRLGKRYTPQRLEAACARALALQTYSYTHVQSILQKGLDTQPLPDSSDSNPAPAVLHENLRGSQYYQ
jgi:transposase